MAESRIDEGEERGDGGGEQAGSRAGNGAARRGSRRLLLTVAAAVLGALALAGPSSASAEGGRELKLSFKAAGECTFTAHEGNTSGPGGVAVDEATGEIFVFDRGNNGVDRFSATGTCLSHFAVGKKATGNATQEGIAFDNAPSSPSFGDLYVYENGDRSIHKYRVEGSGAAVLVGQIAGTPSGEETVKFTLHGLSVDNAGDLWAYNLNSIDEFNNEVHNAFVSETEIGSLLCLPRAGFAVGPVGLAGKPERFYVGRQRESNREKCEPTVVTDLLDGDLEPVEASGSAQLGENPTGIAVDLGSGTSFIDNGMGVAEFTPDGTLLKQFGVGSLHEGAGVAASAATGAVYVADAHEGQVQVYVPGGEAIGPVANPAVLPDGRAWEQVTPANKLGSALYPISMFFGVIEASEDGNALTFTSAAPIVTDAAANRAPEPVQNLAQRSATAWNTQDLATPRNNIPISSKSGYGGSEYRFFTPDLSAGLLEPDLGFQVAEELRLAPGATETTLYSRNTSGPDGSCEPVPSACYEALVTAANATSGAAFGGRLAFISATSNGQHAVFLSSVGITPGALREGLYEWSKGGALRLVNLLPLSEGGTQAPESSLGIGEPGTNEGNPRNAISASGSRVFWSASQEAGNQALYVRDFEFNSTLRVDAAQGVAQPKEATSQFQLATASGSRVFFTDTGRLLPESGGENLEQEPAGEGDLYACDLVEREHQLACNLTDLTRVSKTRSAEVQGAVVGASEDGNTVYFVANAALAPGATQGHCEGERPSVASTCNLYMAHFNGSSWQTTFIASLSGEDGPDFALNQSFSMSTISSRVSPNGKYLAFMSARSLTGYDNVDASPVANGARDEEVYLYNAEAGTIACASCNPKGERPQGFHDSSQVGGTGTLVDKQGIWVEEPNEGEHHADHWLAGTIPGWTALKGQIALYQSRYLSNTGRLFFNSTDTLVEGDKNQLADVYEYEPDGEGSCTSETGCVSLISSGSAESTRESVFLDASESGNDVFFLTATRLVEQDTDPAFDIYDARVCTTSSPCIPAPPKPTPECSGEECKEKVSAPALPPVPASTVPGGGNVASVRVLSFVEVKPQSNSKPLTRAQKLAKALKACKKIKKHSKRKACEHQARKKYGPPAKHHKKRSKK
ncbi:MAG TPA: hypothetical protein VFW29_03180 [Solirubrobacteraceae bacterium]|nr:hypothetical protein [Solirubrobacteraceae bacterium]